MLYKNVVYTNTLSLKKYFNDRATYSTMTRIVKDIENLDEYIINKTPIYFIGGLNSSKYFNNTNGFEKYSGTGFTNNFTVTYEATYRNFLLYNLAYPTVSISSSEIAKVIPNFNIFIYNMPSFPQKGYVQYKNGIVLVRLS